MAHNPRQYTTELLNLLEQGIVSHEYIVGLCLNWMSEADVAEMCRAEDIIELMDVDVDED